MSKRKVFLVTSNDPWEVVALGFAGENLARTVEWDIGPWVETYGEGEVQLLAKRPVDKDPYPVVVTRDGNSVLWTVRKEDLWYGNELGQAQLFYLMDGQVVARSKAFRTMTREAIEGDVQECSEPERDWVEQVLQSVAAAEESAGVAGEASKAAEESARQAVEAEERLRQTIEETAVAAAENAANAAVEKATQVAGGAADSAVKSAEDAAGSAGVAREKAEEAGKSAEAAAKSAEAAGLAEEKAETYAGQAEESAADAKEQADAAEKSAELANQSAGRAEEAAFQAAESAEAAAGDASDAKESADDAADSALSAAESAEMAQAYSGKPPVITDDIWYVWDAETDAYLSTGKPSRGEQGLTGPQGVKGEPGAGIANVTRTSGSGLAGTQDVYTVYNSNGKAVGTFSVYQGANGDGAGDFMANGSVAMTGNLDIGGHRVIHVGEPTEEDDVATKAYVDYICQGSKIIRSSLGNLLTLDDSANAPLQGLTLYGRSEKAGDSALDSPNAIVSLGEEDGITIGVFGRNLIDPTDQEAWQSRNGGEVEILGNGKVQVSGVTGYSGAFIRLSEEIITLLKSRVCRYSGTIVSQENNEAMVIVQVEVTTPDGIKYYTAGGTSFIMPPDATGAVLSLLVNNCGQSLDISNTCVFKDIGLYLGDSVYPWDSYHPLQFVTYSAPNGLPGIPVECDGNYMDENGQQWVCDEVDFGRGVYIQRVKSCTGLDFIASGLNSLDQSHLYQSARLQDADGNGYPAVMCGNLEYNRSILTQNVTGFYLFDHTIRARFKDSVDDAGNIARLKSYHWLVQIVPEEIPLGDEIKKAYATLKTYKPYTTIICGNQSGTINVNYEADPSTVISNMLEEIKELLKVNDILIGADD